MSERGSQREQGRDEGQESSLKTERGNTIIQDTVVARIAGRAAQEIEGVHMGGSASRRAAALFGGSGDSQTETQGVSVEVGSEEAAVDLKMAIQYGYNLLKVSNAVRERINERIESWTGLRVMEMNIIIDNILFPEEGERRGGGGGLREARNDTAGEAATGDAVAGEESAGNDTRELGSSATPEGEQTQPLSRKTYEGGEDDEEVRVEGMPLERGEEADMRVGQDGVEKHPAGEEPRRSSEEDSGEEEGGRERR